MGVRFFYTSANALETCYVLELITGVYVVERGRRSPDKVVLEFTSHTNIYRQADP